MTLTSSPLFEHGLDPGNKVIERTVPANFDAGKVDGIAIEVRRPVSAAEADSIAALLGQPAKPSVGDREGCRERRGWPTGPALDEHARAQ